MAAQDVRRSRIAELDQEIAKLQAERHALVVSLAYPVVTLPVEITSQIFVHCLPDDPLDPSASDAAVVLGQVCRQWRNIAISIPELWSSWSLAIDSMGNNATLSRISKSLELWLSRSQNRLLSIRLYHRDGTGQDVSAADENWWARVTDFRVLPILLPHYQRWGRIEFNVPLSLLRELSTSNVTKALPDLTHLVLGSTQEDWGGDDTDDPITLFDAAPKLRSLHIILETQCHLSRFEHVRLPFHQLTSFTGTMFGPLECLVILSNTPALVDCVFHLGQRVPVPHTHLPVALPYLKSLKLLAMTRNVHVGIVLEHLTLPSLETLALGREELHIPPMLETLSIRSGCTIRHFSCEAVEREELAECLQALPMLSTLELREYNQDDAVEVIHHLHYKFGEEGEAVPPLEGITLLCGKSSHHGDFPFNAVLRLLWVMSERPTAPFPPDVDHGAAAPPAECAGTRGLSGFGGERHGCTCRHSGKLLGLNQKKRISCLEGLSLSLTNTRPLEHTD